MCPCKSAPRTYDSNTGRNDYGFEYSFGMALNTVLVRYANPADYFLCLSNRKPAQLTDHTQDIKTCQYGFRIFLDSRKECSRLEDMMLSRVYHV